MIQCPDCRAQIPDDSAFCDQCGKELMWCPECGRPKRGTQCPVCGSDLIPGRSHLSSTPEPRKVEQPQPAAEKPQFTSAAGPAAPTALVGYGWRLTLREGDFGRRGGIWPELGSCQYVSGSHGKISRSGEVWQITDIGSTNGTFINGAKLSACVPAPLSKGDRVKIATLEFTIE